MKSSILLGSPALVEDAASVPPRGLGGSLGAPRPGLGVLTPVPTAGRPAPPPPPRRIDHDEFDFFLNLSPQLPVSPQDARFYIRNAPAAATVALATCGNYGGNDQVAVTGSSSGDAGLVTGT